METTELENPKQTVINISIECLIKDLTLRIENEADVHNFIETVRTALQKVVNNAKADTQNSNITINLGSLVKQLHLYTAPNLDLVAQELAYQQSSKLETKLSEMMLACLSTL
jgi:hypothetical protein